jgi:hypothetical protein
MATSPSEHASDKGVICGDDLLDDIDTASSISRTPVAYC